MPYILPANRLRYSSLLDGSLHEYLILTEWRSELKFSEKFLQVSAEILMFLSEMCISEFVFIETFQLDSGNHHLNSRDTVAFVMLPLVSGLTEDQLLVIPGAGCWKNIVPAGIIEHLIPLCSLPFVNECDFSGVMQKWVLAECNQYESGRSE